MNITHSLTDSAKNELNSILAEISEHEKQCVRFNFRIGDLLNETAIQIGASAAEASRILEAHSEINRSMFQGYGRIAKRIPKFERPNNVSWSVIKYLVADVNPKRLAQLGQKISKSKFSAAAIKALKYADSNELSWAELGKKDDEGVSVGEKLIIRFSKKR
ncbi:MAG: hypothetical protein Q8Q59_09575 [Luteolibacter sp.]|nr:hypothetical protein [Luteolibacter sp.]